MPLLDPETGRLTRMAAAATGGQGGVDTAGYRDYRGVEVVGAWEWRGDRGIGIATEMDRAEAFAPVESTKQLWTIAAGVLTLLCVLVVAAFAATDRRLGRTTRSLERLTVHLREEVENRTAELELSRETLRAEVGAKDDLLAAVSHELRTPLTAVLGFASILVEGGELALEQQLMLDSIVDEGQDMADIVDDLLTNARAAGGSLTFEPAEVALEAEVEAVLAGVGRDRPAAVTHDRAPVSAWADPGRVRQILRNLISNAVRYGGPNIRLRTYRDGRSAVVEVGDDGPAIDPDVSERMFDLYVRGPTQNGLAPSLGVGLALSRRLAEAMGGAVTYRRTNGFNVFGLRLPVGPLVPAAATGSSPTPPERLPTPV